MKIEIKHIAPYLPYKINPLKIKWFDGIYTLDGLTGAWNVDLRQAMMVKRNVHIETIKPILRPLKDKIKEGKSPDDTGYIDPNDLFIDHNGNLAIDFSVGGQTISWDIFSIQNYLNEEYFSKHYDVFGLIPAGLAIDINSI